MQGKTVVVTGANAGIGKATAEALAAQGARVILICRDAAKGEQARQEIIQKTTNQAVLLELCDLGSQQDIHRFGREFRQKYKSIDVLVNNAGAIFGEHKINADGLEMTFALNHIGYFLLTHYLLDLVKNSEMRRIVNVSSLAHILARTVPWDDLQFKQTKYRQFPVYGLSKLYNIFFTRELARQMNEAQTGVCVNCLHPGSIASNFGSSGSKFFSWLISFGKFFLKSTDTGAKSSVFLASSPDAKGITGEYFFNCKKKETSKLGRDMQAAKKMWAASMEITGIKEYGKV